MEEILYRYNPWWEEEYKLNGIIKRNNCLELMQKHFSSRQIIFLTGLRRVGKTTLLKTFIYHLIFNLKIKPLHILYVSLDDYLLAKKNILQIIEEYRKMHKIRFKEKIFLFLDEVTHQINFELQLKNIYDSQNIKVYASSSSASILRSKKPYLTGRNFILEILPLDFNEYLTFKNIKINKSDAHLKEKYFEEYLFTGGLPEYVLRGDTEYLKELVDDIIYKDIVAIYNTKNPQILKDFFLLLMERAGKVVSLNKIARIVNISVDTAKRYLQMFSDTYLIHTISRCGKTNEKILSPKKIYAADLGIRNLFTGFRDKGSLFENYVYLKIKKLQPCYVYNNGIEIDFFTNNKILIEVKYKGSLNEKQLKLFNTIKALKKEVINDFFSLEKIPKL